MGRGHLLSRGIHCIKFCSFQEKGSKYIEQTSLGLQTDLLTGAKLYVKYLSDSGDLRGFDPLLLFFMNEIKIVSYSFSSSVIEYNSNEKLLKA